MVNTIQNIPSPLADLPYDLLDWVALDGAPVLLEFFSSNASSEIFACALPRASQSLIN